MAEPPAVMDFSREQRILHLATALSAGTATQDEVQEAADSLSYAAGERMGLERRVEALERALAYVETRETSHIEDFCHRCGGPNITWAAPSPLWNEVMRGGSINGEEDFNGIICPICFAVLAEKLGVAALWRLSAKRLLVELETVTPTGRMWDEQNWQWVASEGQE